MKCKEKKHKNQHPWKVASTLIAYLFIILFASPKNAFADRIQGFDRFKFGMTLGEIQTVGPGCSRIAPSASGRTDTFISMCAGFSMASSPKFYIDPTTKRVNAIQTTIVFPAMEGDARDLLKGLSKKYSSTYIINDGAISEFFANHSERIAVLGAWLDYSVVLFAERYGSRNQYVQILISYYPDDGVARMKQKLSPLIRARSGSGIDASKY
ncbi:hypothetical protein [Ralstonia sp. SET104]|uniref:hypothetical protein n=1 Tax=Ralstonia sp. SET104 TaxID=2448774 RepID=UPI000F575473|nr:hypothetical protein [Ralstonia sp. SET104]